MSLRRFYGLCAVLVLLAGIVLDTKHFTLRTGGRTFEAAAFLRRSGADTAAARKNRLRHL